MTRPPGWQGKADDPDDSILVQRALAGDREAFGTLIQRYQRLVFRIVGGFLRNREDVEDVAQETFLRAYEGLPGFHAGAPFGPWIARIATRASYDRLRQGRHRGEVAWEDLSHAEQAAARDLAAGADPADRAAVRDLLDRTMASLAPKDRQVLILADALGFSGAEVAQAMGCSSLAARIRLHRARRALRKAVEALGLGTRVRG
ncbi:MAG: sigma-70 family RNA polymerase sigma factor [candidate division NC10 bacterium]